MADLRLSRLTKSYPLSGNERIPISQADNNFNDQQSTFYMSPSSLNSFINENIIPVGTIWPYAGIVNATDKPLPVGWLFCDGSEVSVSTYNDLYLAISNIYGTPTSIDKFKLPDMRCRFVLGYNNKTAPTFKPSFGGFTGEPLNLGQTGGIYRHALTLAEMPAHVHECTYVNSIIRLLKYPGEEVEQNQEDDGNRTYSGNVFPTLDLQASNVGSNTQHNTTPPYVAMHYIIKY